ncbi:MAG TPA: hypothetical protein VMW31_03355 [Devosiaceae bacterium]|nr:hypothetical protein [Devosiaceae bacterium]
MPLRDRGQGTCRLAAERSEFSTTLMECPGWTTRKEIAIAAADPEFTAEQVGWRFAIGTVLLVGAYLAWPLIPFVLSADLDPGVKAWLSGILGATPFLSKFVAILIMGRPAYYFLKRTVYDRIRRRVQRESV